MEAGSCNRDTVQPRPRQPSPEEPKWSSYLRVSNFAAKMRASGKKATEPQVTVTMELLAKLVGINDGLSS